MRLGRLFVSLGCLLTYFFFLGPVAAHGNKVGALVIDHPYAVENPEKPGEYAVYFKELKNMGFHKIITTPHIMSDYYRNTPDIILSGRDKVREEEEAGGGLCEHGDAEDRAAAARKTQTETPHPQLAPRTGTVEK